MFIYKLTNTVNNKIYIGYTTLTIKERCRYRNNEAKYRLDRKSYILNAIRKHGSENFIAEQIDTANSFEELEQKEIYYIKLYKARDRKIGYNLTEGGGGRTGYKLSKETKDKIRQKQLGRKWSEERKQEHSKILKSANIDYVKAKENCRLHNLKTSKKVEKINLKGELIKTFNNITEAANDIGITRSTLSMQLKRYKQREKQGFIYKIKEN